MKLRIKLSKYEINQAILSYLLHSHQFDTRDIEAVSNEDGTMVFNINDTVDPEDIIEPIVLLENNNES